VKTQCSLILTGLQAVAALLSFPANRFNGFARPLCVGPVIEAVETVSNSGNHLFARLKPGENERRFVLDSCTHIYFSPTR
jgi:hypothetical protein